MQVDATPHLLVVDDSPRNIQYLGAVLRDEGYMVSVALDGQQALDRAHTLHPDLVLMDVMMPEMDGLEVCRRMKSDPDLSGIPVIFISAKGAPEDIIEGLSVGGVDYIRKPFQAAEVMQRVKTHLRLSELSQELARRVAEAEAAQQEVLKVSREYASFTRHELSNALGPVLGYSDLLLRRSDLPVETRRSWTEQIRRSALVMKELLGAIKLLQEIEEGIVQLSLSPTNLIALLKTEVAAVELLFQGRGRFILQIPTLPVMVLADATLLGGVFRNLLKNALEHVQDLPPASQGLLVVMRVIADEVHVDIHNGGDPIPPARLITFFDKFNSTKRQTGGTGLGTSYARIVVRAHGGSITVESDATRGTCVSFRLPVAAEEHGAG